MGFRVTVTIAVLTAACFWLGSAGPVAVAQDEALRIIDLQYLESGSTSRLVIRANLPFTYRAYSEDAGILVIETDAADTSDIAPGITIGSRFVHSITVENKGADQDREVTAITIRYRPENSYEITPRGRRLFIDFAPDDSVAEIHRPSTAYDTSATSRDAREEVEPVATSEPEVEESLGGLMSPDSVAEAQYADSDSLRYRLDPVVTYSLIGLRVDRSGDGVEIVISTDRSMERRLYRIVPVGPPPRYVVDLHGATNNLQRGITEGASGYFSSVRTSQFDVNPYPISRVVLDIEGPQWPQAFSRGNDLILSFGATRATETNDASGSDTVQVEPVVVVSTSQPDIAEPEEEAERTTESAEVAEPETAEVQPEVDYGEQVETLDDTADLAPVHEPAQLAEPATEREAGEEPTEAEAGEEFVSDDIAEPEQIEIQTEEDSQLLIEEHTEAEAGNAAVPIDVVEPEPAEIQPEEDSVELSETREDSANLVPEPETAVGRNVETEITSSGTAERPEPMEENLQLFSEQYPDGMRSSSAVASVTHPSPVSTRQEQESEQPQQGVEEQFDFTAGDQEFFRTREITPTERRYRGRRVNLEFESISLRALILLLGQMTDKNFIVDPSVRHLEVSLSLRDVPWDQALEIILDYHGLGSVEEDNVIRIATRQRLTQEAEERRQLALQRALAVPRRQVTRPVNYAKASDMMALIRRNLSSQGEVVVDERTNTLVITDIPSKVDEHLALLEALDIPTRQVIVEARIVETTRDFINEFGLQYGFRASATSEYGSSTGLIFPNQMTISGGGPDFSPNLLPFAVNLPASTVNSSILGSFANINGSFILDAILTAAESERKVRVLSRPRISALNNDQAEIKSGIEVPYQVIQNNTVSIRWREATLRLTVTPHITSDATVILDVEVDKSSLGIQTAAGFTIQTRQATSTVLVPDGGVAVIGGVLEISENITAERTPFLHRIPLIGRLFRSRQERIQNTELLIFISPKIIG